MRYNQYQNQSYYGNSANDYQIRHSRSRSNRKHGYKSTKEHNYFSYLDFKKYAYKKTTPSPNKTKKHIKEHKKDKKKDKKHKRSKSSRTIKKRRHYSSSSVSSLQSSSSSFSSSKSNMKSQKSQIIKHSDSKDRTADAGIKNLFLNSNILGHYKFKVGEVFQGKYKIIKHLSDGTFGRVFEVKSYRDSRIYALKVIRAVDRYIDSAQTEAQILQYIHEKDPDGDYHHVKLTETFQSHKNYCMVFERLGLSLYDVIKKNNYQGLPIYILQSIFKQILEAIGFLHKIGLTHTDLKPENILFVTSELKKIKTSNYKKSSSGSTSQEKDKGTIYLPKKDEIKIIDYGGATYDDEHHSSIINTRQYRAPEVILGCCEWSHISDMWSIGCIMLEIFSGDLFFGTHQNYEHLAMIEKACGHIPQWMARKTKNKLGKHFKPDYPNSKGSYFDWPEFCTDNESQRRVKSMLTIEDIIPRTLNQLQNLLHQCLEIDPKKRISCAEALKHPFFDIRFEQYN